MLKKIIHLIFPARDMFPPSYQGELHYQSSKVIFLATIFGILAWLTYIDMDAELYPNKPEIIILRYGLTIVSGILFVLQFFPFLKQRSMWLLYSMLVYLVGATGIITGLTGGDPFYTTGFVFIIMTPIITPIDYRLVIITSTISVAAFFIIGIQNGLGFEDPHEKYRLNDLLISFTAQGAFVYVLHVIRYNSWKKSNEISKKNKAIIDGINYAKRIQTSLLPNQNQIASVLTDYFVLYKPKEIVSGDFYWMKQTQNQFLFAVADSTGHGVPGAFMSTLGITLLNEVVPFKNHYTTSDILTKLRKKIKESLHFQSENKGLGNDGIDIALLSIDFSTMKLQFSGAYHPLVLIRNNQIIEFRGDKQPIGAHIIEKDFTHKNIDLFENDVIYCFSDGFVDQYGGPHQRKIMKKQFYKILLDNHSNSFDEQKKYLNNYFQVWKGSNNQIDDMLVVGFKINEPIANLV